MTRLVRPVEPRRIGFVSTRFSGTDGVTLETEKWAEVLKWSGHSCFYFAGDCDLDPENSYVAPEAHFDHPEIAAIYQHSFREGIRSPEVTRQIYRLKDHLKGQLHNFINQFRIELLLVENALAIPMNLPLGLALTELIAETGLPVIAHHHDFFWERQRFLVNSVNDFLRMAFPPDLPSVRHVVINTQAARELSMRVGVSSTLIPNVMDFDSPPPAPDAYTEDLPAALGLAPGEKLILQPTRVVRRKGIEHAIELVRRLDTPARLVISHAAGDEGFDYEMRVRDFAKMMDVPVIFVSDQIQPARGRTPDGRKIFTLADVYQRADLVTYPSELEGFGNAFLEAIYYCRPLVMNNYSIYATDIQPKGFQVVEFDGFVTPRTVDEARQVLLDPQRAREMGEHNFALGKRHYSFAVLARLLRTLLAACFGVD